MTICQNISVTQENSTFGIGSGILDDVGTNSSPNGTLYAVIRVVINWRSMNDKVLSDHYLIDAADSITTQ